jgi:uncharacterized protein (DUF2141 family)
MTPLRPGLVRHVLVPANLIVVALVVFGMLASTVEGDLRRVPRDVDPDLPRPAAQAAAAADPGKRGALTVKVLHVKNAAGKVLVWVYARGPLQDGTNIVARRVLPASTAGVTAVFDDLPRGPYAVLAVHDENGNGILDMGPAGGPPAEGIGTSRADGLLRGPPTFEEARFDLDRDALEIEVPVLYY